MGVLDTAKPFYRLEIVEPGASEPKYVLSPNIFLESEQPLNSNQAASEIYLTNLNITSKLNGYVNICELELRHSSGFAPAIAMDSIVKVRLGYYTEDHSQGQEYSMVYTGHVTRIDLHLQKTLLECRSDIYRLAAMRKKMQFNRLMTLDEVITKLAIDEGLLEPAQDGIARTDISKQPGFSISNQRTVLDHLELYARYAGLYIYMDVFDKFHASGWSPSELKTQDDHDDPEWITERGKNESSSRRRFNHILNFGQYLIACNFELAAQKVSGIEVIGYMPFPNDQVHTIDPPLVEYTPTPDGTLDQDAPKKRFKLSHVTRGDAEKIAENLYHRLDQRLVGKVKVQGAPQIRLGDGIQFKGDIYGVPPFQNFDPGLGSKTFMVVKVDHKFNDDDGFVTLIDAVEVYSA